MSSQTQRLSVLALAAGGAALFSLKGVIMKLAFVEGATVEQMMALRMGIALPVYIAVAWVAFQRHPIRPGSQPLWAAVALGVLSYYICTWLDFTGLQFISAQLERLILFLYPTITAVLAWAFLGDRITWRHAAALVLSYAGVAVLVGREVDDFGPNAALGAGLVFSAAALFAGYVTASKPVISTLGSALFTSTAMMAATIPIFVHFLVQSSLQGPPPMSGMIFVYGAILAIGCTLAPSFMISEGIARIGPGPASAVGGVGPAATAGVAVFVLGEPFGWPQAAALALTVGGVLLLAGAGSAPRRAASV